MHGVNQSVSLEKGAVKGAFMLDGSQSSDAACLHSRATRGRTCGLYILFQFTSTHSTTIMCCIELILLLPTNLTYSTINKVNQVPSLTALWQA